jgi:RimJ/RimL family protein N-acetyltransferase
MNRDDIARYNVTEVLHNQRTVTIRAIRPDDKGLVIEVVKEVSPESIYRRIFAVKRELTDQELKSVTEVDFVDVVQLVAVLEKDGRDHIVGGGRYMRTGASGTGQKAEVAFLVDDAFQGLGIASRIFRHLLAIARASGITQFEAEVLPANDAMLRVFARAGVPMKTTPADGYVYVLMQLTGGGETPSGGNG